MKRSMLAIPVVVAVAVTSVLLAARLRPTNADDGQSASIPIDAPVFIHSKIQTQGFGPDGKVRAAADSELWVKVPDKGRLDTPRWIEVWNGLSTWRYDNHSMKWLVMNTRHRRSASMFTPEYVEKLYRREGASVSRTERTEVTPDNVEHRVVRLDVEHLPIKRGGIREAGPIRWTMHADKRTGYLESARMDMYDPKSGRLLSTSTIAYDYPKSLPDDLFTPKIRAGQ